MGVLTGGTSYHAALRRDSALLVEISARPPQRQWHLIRHTKGGLPKNKEDEPCTQVDQRELRVQRPQWKESWTNRDWCTRVWGQAGNSLLQTHIRDGNERSPERMETHALGVRPGGELASPDSQLLIGPCMISNTSNASKPIFPQTFHL